MAHQAAARGDEYGYIYSPLGQPIRARLDSLANRALRASWFDPRTGEETVFAIVPPRETLFVPPTSGKGCDWVLALDVVPERTQST
ncbi:MAG: putative collagen-binding domain-containing protein [Anaerolineae bacterium]